MATLAFLAPDLQRAILSGEQPERGVLAILMETDVPLAWSAQGRMFEALEAGKRRSAG